ncbi:MAG: hypothetical protein NC184_04790 [Roseburia sp.]|nr:hypothetical protein [Roseburia sp.]
MRKKKQKQDISKLMKFENGQFFFGEEKYSYKKFLKNYCWLHLIIIGLLLVAMLLTILAYSYGFTQCCKLKEPDCWVTIISFSLAYLGAAFLGIVVFYNTCQRQYIEDREANLKFNINARPMDIVPLTMYSEEFLKQLTFKCWGGKNKQTNNQVLGEKGYIKFQIKNYNYRYPMYINIVDAYYNDGSGNIVDAKSIDFKLSFENNSPLDYKEEGSIYIGIDNTILTQLPKTIAYVFKLKNVKDIENYCVCFVAFNDVTCSCVIKSISIEEYDKSMREKNHPLGILEVYLKMGQNS